MNQKFISSKIVESVVLVSLLAGLLAFGNFKANAAGFNSKAPNHGNVLSTGKFYNQLEKTKPANIAKTFGMPDEIRALKSMEGDTIGVVWVYRDAVAEEQNTMDANFVLVKGNFKYVTLSKAS